MRIVHLHTGSDGRSHFEDVELHMTTTDDGAETALLAAVQGVAFREVPTGWSLGYHNAPRRQIVVQLSGAGELICGDGTSRIVGPGDVVLADDGTGQGHISREVSGPRSQAVIYLDPNFDLDTLFARS